MKKLILTSTAAASIVAQSVALPRAFANRGIITNSLGALSPDALKLSQDAFRNRLLNTKTKTNFQYGNSESVKALSKITYEVSTSDKVMYYSSKTLGYIAVPVAMGAYTALAPVTIPMTIALGVAYAGNVALLNGTLDASVKYDEALIQDKYAKAASNMLLDPKNSPLKNDLDSLDQIEDPVERQAKRNQFIDNFSSKYQEQYGKTNISDDDKVVKNEATLQVHSHFFKILFESKADIEQKMAEQQEYQEKMGEDLAKEINANAKAIVATNERIEDAKKQIVEFEKNYIEGLNKSLSLLDKKLSASTMIQYNNMTPGEKLEALRPGGLLDGIINEAERENEIKTWTKANKLDQFVKNVRTVALGVQTFANVGKALGMSPELVKPFEAMANSIEPLVNLTLALSGPGFNPIAFFNGVNGVLAITGGMPDIAGMRHSQITGMLDQLLHGQQTIIDNQKLMLENQRGLIRGQIEIANRLQIIDNKMNQLQMQVSNLHDEVVYNGEKLSYLMNDKFNSCYAANSMLERELSRIKSSEGQDRPLNRNELNNFVYITNSDNLEDCYLKIQNTISLATSNTDSSQFSEISASGFSYSEIQERRVVFDKMLKLAKLATGDNKNLLYNSLLFSLPKLENTNQVMNTPSVREPKKELEIVYSYLDQLLMRDLSNHFIAKLSDVFVKLLPYIELKRGRNKSISDRRNALLNIANLSRDMHDVTLVHFAQTELLSGSILLPYLYQNANSDVVKKVTNSDLLQMNPQFYSNYIRYIILEGMKKLTSANPNRLNSIWYYEAATKKPLFRSDAAGILHPESREYLEELLADKLGFGLKLQYSSMNTRVKNFRDRIEQTKALILSSKGKLSELMDIYDPKFDAAKSNIDETKIKDFVEQSTDVLNKLQNILGDYNSTSGNSVATHASKLIEDTDLSDLISYFRASPYESTIKNETFSYVQQVYGQYVDLLKTIDDGLKNKSVLWLTDDKGRIYELPTAQELINGGIKRKDSFASLVYTALQLRKTANNYMITHKVHSNEYSQRTDIQELWKQKAIPQL